MEAIEAGLSRKRLAPAAAGRPATFGWWVGRHSRRTVGTFASGDTIFRIPVRTTLRRPRGRRAGCIDESGESAALDTGSSAEPDECQPVSFERTPQVRTSQSPRSVAASRRLTSSLVGSRGVMERDEIPSGRGIAPAVWETVRARSHPHQHRGQQAKWRYVAVPAGSFRGFRPCGPDRME